MKAAWLAALACLPAIALAEEPTSGRRVLVSYASFTLQQRAAADSNEAFRQLQRVKTARSGGEEALRSERAGGADENLVHHRYWQRQEKLRHAVELAQRRYNDTLRTSRR